MIAYLKGRVLDMGSETLILEVNGVGYELYCSAKVFSLARIGGELEVYTSMQVKEDGITLYGFASPKEKELFLKLTSVSGVGPKSGIAVCGRGKAFRRRRRRRVRVAESRFYAQRKSACRKTREGERCRGVGRNHTPRPSGLID